MFNGMHKEKRVYDTFEAYPVCVKEKLHLSQKENIVENQKDMIHEYLKTIPTPVI